MAAALCLATWLWRERNRLSFPPGPRPIPLLGNIADIPVVKQWEAYRDLGTRYGPIVHLQVLYRHLVIVNDAEVASDLCEKRSAVYSGRPPLPMISDLMGWSWNIGFMDYGPVWKAHRRVLQRYFGNSISSQHTSLLRKNTRLFLSDVLAVPSKFEDYIRRAAAANVLTMAYGIDIARHGDPLVVLADKASNSIIAAGLPGSFAVDWFPFLKHVPEWFPGAGFQRIARESRALSSGMKETPYTVAKEAVREGRAHASLVLDSLNSSDGDISSDDLIKNSAGAMYLAAVDTITAQIMSFIMAMLRNSTACRKVQEELNRAVGDARLPEYADRAQTPFLDACILESCRLYPVAPLGVPHCTSQDDEYRGFRITQGTTIIVNSWAILRDPKRFPEPEAFKPERYLDANGRLDPSTEHPNITMFGWGRRICPGRYFADSTLWFAAAGLLSCFNLACELDVNGKPIIPTEEMHSGLVAVPAPFSCVITPRSEKHAELVRTAQDDIE
ncbi:cytochrome P450 [Exidia glandulosa HHB12029]|uniref:Cytochrome P450 n=1 Tax=Exidia glandulosa HHB12029 TaxID=1314781 RepID=A0A165GBP7_EXIGL|nr:cytochrome P450 [Exidia glandulosa HHB12029]